LISEPLEVEHRKSLSLPLGERLDRSTNRRIPARLGNPFERVIRRIGEALDERGQDVPLLIRSAAGVARSSPLTGSQRVESDVAGDPDDPRAQGFAFAETFVPLESPAEGLICTVFHVGVVDPLANDACHDGANERPERGRFARETIVFSLI
jgi:hypothetical protein